MTKKVKPEVKSLDELDTVLAQEANEIEMDDPTDPDELVFEDGPLAGKKASIKQFEKGEVVDAEPAAAPSKEQKAAGTEQPDPAAADPAATDEPASTDSASAEPAAKETVIDPKETPAEEPYKANTVYKVYDQEKQFPDWAKPLATSKETEENLRSVLQRSEAFDTLRTKHTDVVRERDQNRSYVEEHVQRVQRLDQLREKDLPLFLRTMNVDPQALVKYAANLAHQQDNDPHSYAEHLRTLDSGVQNFNREFETARASESQGASLREIHQNAVAMTLSSPEVASFKQRMDAVHGSGAFEKQFNGRGSFVYQNEGRYVPPAELAQWVMANWGPSLPPVVAAPVPTPTPALPATAKPVQTPAPAPAHVAPRPAPQRVKTLPNFGRGSNASPTRTRPKSFNELEKLIESEA